MTANDIKWSNLCLVCCVAVVAMSRRRRIASITSWQKRQCSQKIYSTKGILGRPLDEVSIIHHTLDSIGFGWTLDTGLEKQTSSRVDLSKTLGDTPKSKMSMFMFFFLIFLINPWDFFPGYPLGIPFLERPGGRRARKEQ